MAKEIKINGCFNCPLCDMNDMGGGYSCRLEKYPNNQIDEDYEKFQPITPDWCPLKKESVEFKFSNDVNKK